MNKQTSKILNVSRRLLLETSLTEKQIAKTLFISETNFRYLYHKYFDLPPKKYIKKVKLKKAKTLIRITNKNITYIAYDLGYINTSKFSEDFKKEFNISPREYRKIC